MKITKLTETVLTGWSQSFFHFCFSFWFLGLNYTFRVNQRKKCCPLPFLDTSQIKFQAFLTSGLPPWSSTTFSYATFLNASSLSNLFLDSCKEGTRKHRCQLVKHDNATMPLSFSLLACKQNSRERRDVLPYRKPAGHRWVEKLADSLEICPEDEQSTCQTEFPSLQCGWYWK